MSTETTSAPVRRLTCCCCAGSTTGRQWYNRDTGYGLCTKCADWIASRPRKMTEPPTADEMQSLYGVRGTHYDLPVTE